MTVQGLRTFLLTALVIQPVSEALAQAGSTGRPRDIGPPVRGAAVIRGQVLASDTNVPIRDAIVVLRPAETVGPAIIAPRISAPVRVDGNGQFEIAGIAAGRYRLVAEPGSSAARYVGTQHPDPASDDGQPLVITENQVLEGIQIPLRRAAAISGRVVDERGLPLAHVSVQAIDSLPGDRRRVPPLRLSAGVTDRTDDNGTFRLFGLRPGEYVLHAESPGGATVIVESNGSKMVATPESGYVSAFYPGTLSAADAARIRVHAGDEFGPVDFVMARLRLSNVRGVLLDPAGQPVSRGTITLRRADTPAGGKSMSRPTRPDGTFELYDVPPGDYSLVVHRYDDGVAQFAFIPLAVAQDVDGLVVRLQNGVSIQGHVIFEGAPPASHARLQIQAMPQQVITGSTFTGVQPAADGTFAIENQFGPTFIRASGLTGWHLKAVRQAGRDITDQAVDFGESSDAVDVILTRTACTLAGSVATQKGTRAEAAVLLFSEDHTLWHERASTTKLVTSDVSGQYRIAGLRPGRYLALAASRDDLSLSNTTPAFFELLARHSTPVVITDGERTLDLKVVALR
jgi:hypothetical protein